MQVSVESISPIERRMKVTVDAARVNAGLQEGLTRTQRTVRVDGFRPGKVPMSVVRQRFGDSVRQEVVGQLVRDTLLEAISQQELRVAGYPAIDEVNQEGDQALEFVAVFEVYPDVTLADFTSLSVVRPEVSISDADVDEMILNLRKQKATWTTVDRAATLEDRVSLDYEGSINGVPFEGGKAEGQTLVLGSGRMIPGFEEGVVGMTAGEEKTITVTFPEDYQAENLRGKQAQFLIHAKLVEEQHLPELNDEFVREFSEQTDLHAFREEVRGNMERELKAAVRQVVKKAVFDVVVGAHEVSAPKTLVREEIERQRQQAVSRFGWKNIDPRMLPDEMFSVAAERSVNLGLVVGEIIRHHKLEVDQDRLREFVRDIAAAYEDPQQVMDWYLKNNEQRQQLESVVLEDQVVDWLLGSMQVQMQPSTYREILQQIQR
ncbi:MAG: trigger factor [Pseudomonadales bacterium]|nr:trigger factor [Pseudomonadales bacterium]